MKVLVAEEISNEAVELMRREGLQIDVKTGLKKDELLGIIQDYDALVVRSQIKVDREIIERAKNLKIIGRAGVGVDNIDLDAASQRGIIVVNAQEEHDLYRGAHDRPAPRPCEKDSAGISVYEGEEVG
jgi:D-3-phosphoglycerate dehydrogenase